MGEQATTTSKLEQDLYTTLQRLPPALHSSNAGSLLDCLSSVFSAADAQPIACQPAPARDGANIWKQLLQRVPDGAPVQEPPAPASVDTLLTEAAKLAHHVDELRRTATTPLHDLGWRLVHGYRGPCDIVKCQTCGRAMLLAAFEQHRTFCRRRSREPTPTLSVLNNSTSMGGSEGSGREPSPGRRRASRGTAPGAAGPTRAMERPHSTATDPGPLMLDGVQWRAPTPLSATSPVIAASSPSLAAQSPSLALNDTTKLWGDQQLRFASRGQRSQPSRKRRKTLEAVNVLTPTPPALPPTTRPVPAIAFERIPPGGKVTIGAAGVLAATDQAGTTEGLSGRTSLDQVMFGGLGAGGLADAGLEDDFLIDPMAYDGYDQHNALLPSNNSGPLYDLPGEGPGSPLHDLVAPPGGGYLAT